ncbi:MAG: DNA mismatch repair endonuclease MutL [Chitinophagales bacterium]
MSDLINLLPDAIANQIAAGEVVQRPASVVKEMMENSVDAGARNIQLIIKDAGKQLIQVTDDGTGMSETDARMSFERHATSKIRTVDDLFAIRTMGFRGEAMASIAAVAKVELKSRQHDKELGTKIIIEGSELITQEPCQCPAGTSISVKNLFYNVPARRNFLKSNPVETRHMIDEFTRLALAHPDIHFTMQHNGLELFHLNSANLRQRIVSIFGNAANGRIVPIEEETDIVKLYGFIGKPEFAKKTRGDQFLFINDRFVKNNYLNHAVFSNYNDLIPKGNYPFFVLFLEINPQKVDINVHPTKQEVKFEDERAIYNIVRASTKHALAKYSVTPTLDFEQEQSFNRIQGNPGLSSSDNFNPEKFAGKSGQGLNTAHQINAWKTQDSQRENNNLRNWEKLFDGVKTESHQEEQSMTLKSSWDDAGAQRMPHSESIERKQPYQLHGKYILSPIKSGCILIDQHLAHERILYEKLMQSFEQKKVATQKQLFPQTVTFSAQDSSLVLELLNDINALGFDIQEFGKNTFVVHGVPADIGTNEEQVVLEELIENYKQNLQELKLDKRESLARSLAHESAIKKGKLMEAEEMKQLVDELFACEQPYLAPNGKKTFITLDFQELEKRFES